MNSSFYWDSVLERQSSLMWLLPNLAAASKNFFFFLMQVPRKHHRKFRLCRSSWGLGINWGHSALLKDPLQFSNVMILKGRLIIKPIFSFILSSLWVAVCYHRKPRKVTDPTENKSKINHWYRGFIQERNLGKLIGGMKKP